MYTAVEKIIRIKDRDFRLAIPSARIQERIGDIAGRMNSELRDKDPLFISVLNGAFLFTADLVRRLDFSCGISFVRTASYSRTASTGKVQELIGMNENVQGRTVVIIEDIVDSGLTLARLHEVLSAKAPGEIRVATLLFKPLAYKGRLKPDYVGMEVPNDFLVGYGLDYDGQGRNLNDIYSAI